MSLAGVRAGVNTKMDTSVLLMPAAPHQDLLVFLPPQSVGGPGSEERNVSYYFILCDVRACVCVCAGVYLYTGHVCAQLHMCVCVGSCVYICVQLHVYVQLRVCRLCVYLHVCANTYAYVQVHMPMYV